MFQNTSRRAISLTFLLVASITFQSFAFMPGGVAMAQKLKPLRVPAGKPTGGVALTPPSASITATKVDAWDDTATPDLKAEPGQTITYTVTITNTGAVAATGVTFTDTVDPNTTLVPGSVMTQPIASPDSYNVIGNVRIQPNAAAGLLANDADPDPGDTLTASGPTTTTQGGNLTINADGSFVYNPAPGFAGTDTFTYTITDSTSKTDTAVATLKVGNGTATPGTNVVWFVDPNAGAGGDGRLTSPFNCYTGGSASCFSQTAADEPGDTIFLYSGAHTGGYTLLSTQKLIGQGASANLETISALTVQTYSDPLPTTGGASPTMTTTNVTAVPLGLDNTVRGFTIGNVGTGTKISGVSFGTLTVGNSTTPDMILNGTGQALNLSTGTLAATSAFASVASTSSSGQGINLAGLSGTLAMGSTTISGSTTQGILVGTTTAAINFGNTSVSGGTDGVSFQNNSSGTRTFGTLSISNNSGIGFLHAAGGNVSVTGTTLIPAAAQTAPAGTGIDINALAVGTSVTFADVTVNKGNAGTGVSLGTVANPNLGNVSFNSLGITASNGTALLSAANTGTTGSITVTTNAGSIAATGGPAINITKTVAPATPITLNFTTVASTNSATTGITIDRVSGNLTISTTTTTNPMGNGISVQNTSVGGTMNFGNTTSNTSGANGVNLASNAGAVTFNDLDIAPDATFGGISVASSSGTTTSSTGTITTTDAPAVSVTNSALNMTLTSVSADNTGDADSCVTLTTASGTLTMNGGALIGGTSAAFFVSGGNPTVTYAGTVTQNSAARVVDIQGTTGNSVSFTDTGTAVTGGASSLGVHIGDTSAVNGNVTFAELNLGTSGARMTNQAVTITNGTGTYSLGAISIFTNAAQAIVATNADGTLNTTSGTVDTTSQRAINIDGPVGLTTLGMTLTAVLSTSSSTNGITIQDTNGTFTVAGSAGTCTLATQTCTGGSIQSATAAGILLNNASGVSLSFMKVQNSGTDGISMTGGNNFTLNNSIVTDTAGATQQDGIEFDNVTGTITLSSIAVSGSPHDNIDFDNNNTNLTAFNLTNSTIQNTLAGTGANGILFVARGTSVITAATLTGNTISGSQSTGIQPAAQDTANIQNFIIGQTGAGNGNTISGNNAGIDANQSQAANITFRVVNNTFNTHRSQAINAFAATASTGGTMTGFIQSNSIGTAGTLDSGSAIGSGIRVVSKGGCVGSFTIDSNTVREVPNGRGIEVTALRTASGNGGAKVKVTNNTVTRPTDSNQAVCGPTDPCPLASVWVSADNETNSGNETVCSLVSGNTAYDPTSWANGGEAAYYMQENNFTGPATHNTEGTNANVATQISSTNTVTNDGPGANVIVDGGVATVAPGTCGAFPTTPSLIQGAASTVDRSGERPSLLDARVDGMSNNLTQIAITNETTMLTQASVTGSVLAERQTTAAMSDSLARAKVDIVRPQASEVKLNHATTANTKSSTANTAAVVHPAPLTPGGGGTVNVTIGTLAPGDSVTITFQVVIDDPYSGGLNVSNQGSVSGNNPSAFTNLTDDPDTGTAGDPTLTPINSLKVSVKDAKVAEPTSGSINMVFTVALSAPAGAGGASVDFTTADEPAGPGKAVAGTDYTTTSGTINFASGQQVRTINVPVLSDGDNAEPDETFLVNLSNAAGATILDGQAVGTITVASPPGTFLISELRTFGPGPGNDPNDEFVEFYNNTNSSLTVAASDASAGYGVFVQGADCNATPVLVGTIPNNTVIPARGHYLMVGTTYSLANYGGTGAAAGNLTLSSDIPTNGNVAVFSTSDITSISSTNRLDAVGFGLNTGSVCDLLREPTNATAATTNLTLLGQHSYFRKECDFAGGCQAGGNPKETNDNSVDFMFADANATAAGPAPHLGAPGPENLASPIRRDNAGITSLLLDTTVSTSAQPNRFRSFTVNPPNEPNGSLEVRRRVVNNTASTVTRLRFRIVELTTAPTPPSGVADLRAVTSSPVVISNIQDAATCASTGTPATVPCQVTAQATVLETPPAQPSGGGYNATLTVAVPGGLAPNASIDVNFRLGVVQAGTFRFYIIIEALP
jgi:hypothetical protein